MTKQSFKVGEGDYITKYCELTTETISQAMEHVGLDPGVTETGKRTCDKLNNNPDWEEYKEYKPSQLNSIDKDNMFGI